MNRALTIKNNPLRQRLVRCQSYDDCFRLALQLKAQWTDDSFHQLMDLALFSVNEETSTAAAICLVTIEPECPLRCYPMLLRIHQSTWNGKFCAVALYLISQFGKPAINSNTTRLLDVVCTPEKNKSPVAMLDYWLRFSTLDMSERINVLQWTEH